MAEASNSGPSIGQQNLVLAKLLLRKFNLLHEFHASQLQYYIIACCKSSIGGEVAVNPEERLVSFRLKTLRHYKFIGKKVVLRHKFSLVGKFKFPDKSYEIEKKTAIENLNAWTKDLLWGPETRVRIVLDGIEIS